MSFENSILARALRVLAKAVYRHPAWFIYPQLILAAVGVFYTVARLELDMNRDNLIGPRARHHQIYMQF
ncbi:MAG TPA: hypothetical protein VNT26_02885, partial [Candidatus Sulfotelmatobacter sp.]|nr:hypothetical protein [Candidatus Sulfotelmatobacter sp.]